MTQFVTHIPVDISSSSRPYRHHHHHHHHHAEHSGHGHGAPHELHAHVHQPHQQQPQQQSHHHAAKKTDGNASFLRAARAGNLEKVLEYLKGSIDINTSNANGLNALHLAAKEGHVNVVSELLKRGANVNAATKKGNTALHMASLAGQEEVVKLLVEKQANVNVQSQSGFTPLYMAAQENHDAVVRFLLAHGANQSLATEDGFTPLAVALQQGHDKVVAVLLENDARGKVRLPALHIASKKDDCKAAALLLHSEHNPDVTSKSGFTPLHIAAHYGNSNIASLLLEKGADVNFPAKHQITPLHVAAKWGKSNMVKLLLEKGAKMDASTRDGLTPLHCAARSGHDQVVEQLLEKNAPITAKTKNGLAPLHMASQGDHVDSARILLYHKAPVDDVTVDYLTALHVAAHCGHVGVAKLLLDRKADPNARALNGFTPLHIACKKNRIKVVELLLKHGASIEATTESGLTPLHVASFMGCMNIVIYLIQHGANPDIPTVRGETPLHLAARANQTDIIRILLRNGAHVDAKARELQTALHIASRLGNADMVGLLLQHGAAVDAPTKDAYTPLHVAAREGQDEVAALLLDHGAALAAPTKKGFTPLHLAAKYGNIKVAKLLLQKDAPVDAQGKNGVTPLHVAAHYDHVNVALLLLEKGASPHAAARNGYTPLHVAARKDQMDIASSLLEYGARPGAESRAGFTPLHLAAQEGHADLAALLVEHGAECDAKAKNGLTPLHLCAQEDRVNVAAILAKSGATIDPTTKAGYTPLHVACHFGQTNMIRFLLRQGANVNATTTHGYTPLHQAAQQGHTLIINLLLEHRASPNATTKQGQTALSIAQRLGYISVVETLKVVTETTVTTTITTVTEEKYKVVAPETMHETFMSDSEDEGAEDNMLGDQSFRYLTADEMKSLGDDSLPIDVTRDERLTESIHVGREPGHVAPLTQEEERLSPTQAHQTEAVFVGNYAPDNVDISRTPIHAGSKLKWKTFLVSFLVDARGGAMRGCRHSGVRVIIPPRKAQMPMRITCRYLRKEKLPHPPPLLEGEACASRILEVGPAGAKFLGPVILEVPHFASLRGKEREITILRSDNGETWKEHTLEASEEAVQEVLNESFEGEELSALEDLQTNRITRILTTDFPQYFAVVSRTRQEVHAVGPEGGMLSSTVVPQVQAIFPEGALTKKIRVGLQAQPIQPELVTKLLGHRVAVSPIVTVEPRRRKFHKPITLTIPVPQAATKGMINQYAGDAPTLRLLCSITASRRHGQLSGEYRLEAGGANKAQWEDVTGSTPLTFVNDCVSFTTTVSARFWLMDCRQVSEATKFATELYAEAIHVPFMAKFVVFAKRQDPMEAQLRVFCMTDDREDKTLETQEHFSEVAKSRDVEVLENKSQYLEFAGNLVPVTKSGEQLKLHFQAFRENRVPFVVRVKDIHQEPLGRVAFMREPRAARTEPPQVPLCNLNIALPEFEASRAVSELVTLEKKYGFVEETGLAKPELIHRADLRLSDIARELGADWVPLAAQLDVPDQDVSSIRSECPSDLGQQALLMLRLWMKRANTKATGNNLEKGLRRINREDIVNKCMFNVELVTDDVEKAVAKVHLDQSGFDTFREELGAPKTSSLKRDGSLDVSYDEPDLMKEAESAEETSSETGSVQDRHASSEAKGQGKGSRKGSPISAVLGRLVRGSSKEKAAPTMAIAENFDEEPTTPKRERSEKTKEGIVREASPVATPPDSKKKSKKEKSPPLPASPPSDKSDTKKSGHGSPRSGSPEKDVVVQEVVQAASVAGSKKGKTPEPKEKSVEKVPHVPSSEAAKEPPASSAMKTPGENGLSNSKPEEISRGAPPPVPKRDVKKTPGGIVETVEVIKHQVGKVTDLFPKLGKKGKGEKGAPTVSAAEPGAAKGSPAKELKETPGGVVEIVQVTKHEVAKGSEESPKKVKGKSPEKKSPPEADASAEKPSVTTKREIRETPGGLMEVVEVTKHDIGRMPEVDGTFSVGALEGDPSTVVHREVKETPGGLVEVVRVTKHEVGKLPEGESPSVLGDKIADLPKAPGTTEGEPSTLVRREVKQVPGGLVEVVEVTKHQVGKTLEDKHSPMHGKFPETQIPWEAESQISAAAPSTIVKREVKELPGGHVEVVQVTTHEVGKLPQASDLPGLGESVCDTSITQRIETQIVDGKPTVVRRIITSTPKGVTEEVEPVELDESQPSDSSLFPKMGDLAKFKEDPSAVVKREVKEIPGGVMEVVSVTKHVTSTTPGVEAGDALSSQFPPGSLISERTVSEAFSDFPEGIDETLPGVTRTTVIKKEVSGPDAIVQTTTSVVTSAAAPKGKDDLSADLLDKMFGETKPSQPKYSPLKDVLTPAKVRGAAGKVTAEEAELLAQLFPEQEGAGVTMYPPASRTPEAAIIPEYRSFTSAEATSPADPETKERILLTLGRALSQDDLDAPSPTRGQAVVTPSEEDLKGQVAEPPIERLELPRRISDPPRDDVPSVLAAGAHKVTKATKTPPPSPTTGLHKKDEPLAKTMAFRTKPSEDTVVTSTQVKDVHDDGTVKHTVTTVTKTTIIQEMDEPGSQGPGAAPRAGESEAWASDLDTSQVSVSSLPEDEKTEPTATLSSSATTTTAERDASSSEPLLHTQVEEKEWTETDPDSGGVRHVIRKTTHTTVTSGKQGESALRGGAKSTAETRTTTRDHHQPSDEEESLTFVQKKEFFEKLSEHSPPKDSSRGRLGSTPSLDTTLTRPVATQKPRPRSESLASQGEIVEESIVFSERLRLFQDKDDGSALLEPREAPADLERIEQQVRDVQHQLHTETGLVPELDQTKLRRAQAGPRTERALSDVRSDVSSTPESLDGKSATRLLVRTSEPGKEAFDMRTTEFSDSEGIQEQQFARVLVRSPVPEDGFDEFPATGAPEQLDSALHSAYRESPGPTRQERDHMEERPKAQAKGIGASVDTTAPEKQLAAEPEGLFSSAQSHLLASGLQMGLVAGSDILQKGIEASPKSGILEALSMPTVGTVGPEPHALPPDPSSPPDEVQVSFMGETVIKQPDFHRMGGQSVTVVSAPASSFQLSDVLSGKQPEMLDIGQHPSASSLLEGCVELSSKEPSADKYPAGKAILKTDYAEIQDKLSSAFGESIASIKGEKGSIKDVPKGLREALDGSARQFPRTRSEEDIEEFKGIVDTMEEALASQSIHKPKHGTVESIAEEVTEESLAKQSVSSEDDSSTRQREAELEEALESFVDALTTQPTKPKQAHAKQVLDDDSSELNSVTPHGVCDTDSAPVTEKEKDTSGDGEQKPTNDGTKKLLDNAPETISESLLRNEPDDEESRQKKLPAPDVSTHTLADSSLKDSEDVLTSQRTTEPQKDYSVIVESSHTKKAETVPSTELQKPDVSKEFRDEAIEEFYETTSDIPATETDTYKKDMPCASSTFTEKGTVSQDFKDVSALDTQVYSKSARYMTNEESQGLIKADGPETEVPETISSTVLPPHVATDYPASPHQKDDETPKKTVVSETDFHGTTREKLEASMSEPSADIPGSLAYEVQDLTSKVIEIVKPREKVSFDVPDSSDEDQQSDLAKYKEVELAIPFNLGTSSSLEDDDGGSFSSGDLQLEKIAEFLTTDLEGVRPVHFPQVFQESTIIQQADGVGALSSRADDESKAVPKKRVGFSVEGGSPDSADSAAEVETRQEMAGRIVNNVVHMATSLVESFGGEVTAEQVLRSPGDHDDRICIEPRHQDVFGSPPGVSDVSETLSQVPSVVQEPAGGAFGMKEIYQALKEGQEQRVQFSVRNVADLEEQAGYDEDERRRGSPTAESQDDQARVEKCSRELMMQLLDGFSQSDMELAEVRTEDEAPDIEDDVPSPEGGSAEDRSSSQEGGPRDRHASGDNSGDLHRQSSLEVEIGSQTSGAQTALSEFEFESCPDASVAQAAGDYPPLASRASQEQSPEEREQVATAGPAAAVASVATGRSAAGGREEKRSPLLEASPPEETAYRAEQDISPAQEYPDYLTPEMQVRVGVSPTETSPGHSRPRDQVSGTEQAAVRLSESSVESSSDMFSPKAPASDTDAMAFENVAFAGEDVIDASSSPVEESGSSPAGSRSPYEVVRDGATEKAEATVMGAHLALRTEEPQDDDERKDERPGEKRVTPTRPRSLLKSDEGTPETHVGSEAELRIETHVYGEELDQLAEESALEKREFSEGFLGAGLLSVGIGDARTPESRRGDSDEDEEEWADHVLSKIQGRPIPPTPPASPRAVQSAVEIEERVTWEAPVVEQQELSVEMVREIPAEKQVIVEHDEEADKESAVADGDSITARKRPLLEHIPSEISDEDLVEREQSPTHISATCRGDGKDSSSDRNSSPDSDGPKAGGSHRRSASEAAAIVVETEQKQPPDDNKSSDGDHGKKADDKITKDAALSEEAMGVIEEETPIEFFTEREAHTPDEAQGVPHSSTGKFSSSSGSPPQRKSDGESSATGGKGEGAVVLRSKARTSARKEEKRVSRELDTGHSGSETDQSHYYSFEMTSDSGKTPGVSRPTSSEFDLNVLSGHASSEYETCVTSQDGEASGSYATAATSSQEASYATARSSLSGSSRGSAYSVDSESSGHLGSLEASSEASETIVASAHEDLDSDDNESQRSVSGLREPYDGDIPESVIRGGVEVPFLPSWQSVQKGFDATRAPIGQMVERRETSSFQGVTRDTLAEYMTGSVRWPAEPRHDELDRIRRTEATHTSSKLEALNGAAATSDGQRRPRSVDEPVSNEEEQLSVSESSATQSEHTWQTSVETVVDVVQSQRFSCDNERYQRQSTMLDSVPLPLDEPAMVGDAMDVQVQDAADNGATPPFREINGPVEVDYVPEYDDLVAPPRGVRPLDPLADAEFVAAPAEELSNAAEDFLREHTEAETLLQQQQQQVHDEECEGFYAETFQGELSTEEVEGAVSLADRQYAYSTGSDGLSKDDVTTKEPFERPATPEPPDEIELQEDDGCLPESDQLKSSQTRLGSREPKAAAADVRVVCSPKTATVVKDDLEDACLNEPESNGSFEFVEKTDVIQTACEDEPFEIIPAQSDFCPPQSCCLPENKHAATKAYTSKCEDYLMHMQQTYKYGTIVEKNASESSFPPEEAMDVENVNLLAGKLQEGNGQQGFPFDLSYQQEYADDGRGEYGDLYTHQEVEEEDDDRSRSRSGRRLSPISDERGSTPDYDTLAGRKTFGKGSERDDASTSSLMEFERLEAEMASGGKSSSVGSSDSFSGRLQQARNGGSEQDSVSVNSLTEFEKLEKELVEAEGVDGRLREEPVARLDEIDEGHESQASDPDQELYEGLLRVRGALTESGLQKFVAETEEFDGHLGRTRPDTLPDHWRDKTQVERDFTSEHTERHFLTSRTESGHSVDSVDRQSSASTATQYDADSLKEREMDDFESNQAPETLGWTVKDAADVDRDSLHESERHDSLQEYPSEEKDSLQGMDPSAEMDSLQDDGNNLQDSLHEAREIDWDSFHGDDLPRDWHRQPSPIRTTELSPTMSRPAVSPLVAPVVIERIDTLTWVGQDGEPVLFPAEHLQGDALVSSTDSLEPSSSANTHATYQFETDSMMSSSLTSADESTMVSSTDTLDQEAVRSGLQGRTPSLESPFHRGDDTVDSLLDKPGEFFFDGNATMRRVKRRPLEGGRPPPDDVEARFREYLLQSVVTPADEEQVEERQTLDERGNVVVTRTVKRHLTSEPQLHTQTFSGPDAEERNRAFVASFAAVQPSADKDEYEGFDDAGNAVRVTQRVLVKPSVKTVTFTGPDARAQMQEYMRNSGVGPQSSAENTPTSDSGVGVCSSLASPPALAPDPPATTLPSTAWPGLRRLSGGDQWMEEESALEESAQPVATSRVITTRTIRTVCPDGQEQVVTTTSCDDDSEVRMRRSMQGVLDSFLADSGPPAPARGYLDDNEE